MASQADIEFTYTSIDRIFRMSLGELADFSGARYDGDFSLTLEQAQARKHAYIAEQIGIGPGRRLLDLGCGWGALLDFARRRGADGVGVALSAAQVASCRRHGLDVHLKDARTVDRDSFGPFDAVASLGAYRSTLLPGRVPGRAAGGDLPAAVRERRERAAPGRPLLPPDDGVRAQDDLRSMSVSAGRAAQTPTRSSCSCSGASSRAPSCRGGSISCSAAPSRTSASSRARAAAWTTSRRSASGESGPARRACARTCSSWRLLPQLPAWRDLPLRLHLWGQREQGLLRARAASTTIESCSSKNP